MQLNFLEKVSQELVVPGLRPPNLRLDAERFHRRPEDRLSGRRSRPASGQAVSEEEVGGRAHLPCDLAIKRLVLPSGRKKKKESGVRAPSGTPERRNYPTINPAGEITAM